MGGYAAAGTVPDDFAQRVKRLRGRLGKAEGRIHLPDGTVAAESHMSLADVPRALLDSANPALLNWKVD